MLAVFVIYAQSIHGLTWLLGLTQTIVLDIDTELRERFVLAVYLVNTADS